MNRPAKQPKKQSFEPFSIKRGLIVVLSLLILLGTWAPIWAEGEDDPLWRRTTYEKKVYRIGKRLLKANHITEQIGFTVNRRQNSQANASAGPSGQVMIEKELLNYIESDDELAAVIGHEIGHITMRHIPKRVYGTIAVKSATILPLAVVGALAGPVGVALGAKLGKGISAVTMAGAYRGFESEADRMGLEYMYNAGYDPNAMISIMQKFSGDQQIMRILTDHPISTGRINTIRQLIVQKYSNPPPEWNEEPSQTAAKQPSPTESSELEAKTIPQTSTKVTGKVEMPSSEISTSAPDENASASTAKAHTAPASSESDLTTRASLWGGGKASILETTPSPDAQAKTTAWEHSESTVQAHVKADALAKLRASARTEAAKTLAGTSESGEPVQANAVETPQQASQKNKLKRSPDTVSGDVYDDTNTIIIQE